MNCRSDCMYLMVLRGGDELGSWKEVLTGPRCLYHGVPVIDVIPGQSPCVGEYEQENAELRRAGGEGMIDRNMQRILIGNTKDETGLDVCPLCGEDVALAADNYAGEWMAVAYCDDCGLKLTDDGKDIEDAIANLRNTWNTRHERTCQMNDTTRCDGGESRTWEWVCSACGSRFEHEYGRYVNYCPYCGAKEVDE